jgi:hypothetical protein
MKKIWKQRKHIRRSKKGKKFSAGSIEKSFSKYLASMTDEQLEKHIADMRELISASDMAILSSDANKIYRKELSEAKKELQSRRLL